VRLARLATLSSVLAVAAALSASPAAAATPITATTSPTSATSPAQTELTGDLAAHDPALVAGGEGEDWYVFSTGDAAVGGGTIQIRRSSNGHHWTFAGTVWDAIPEWISEAVPGVNNLWAPEVHYHDGTYYLYYVASIFGKNTSVIALATNTTLNPDDPDYEWVDHGTVLQTEASDDYNAIDPAIIEDADGTPWMAFGSYWSGIRMVQLEWPSGEVAEYEDEPLRLADRREPPNAIEAPYIVQHGDHYYLFTSWDQCCQGVDSNYRIVVGRSSDVTGPYVDKEGRSLLEGGGTELLASAGDRKGPGGQSVSDNVIAYHYYDASASGAPRLALQDISWTDDGWPDLTVDP
jgi:arabinan endo-1,5-alpha-L-arabinosidase